MKSGTQLNNHSLVLKISFGGKSFLFPGDIEFRGEQVLVSDSAGSLRAHVLLSPHHGSKSSSSKAFLKQVQPDICVISSGAGNFFGFPHDQTLQRLQNLGCTIIRTDQAGAVQAVVGRDRFEVTTFLP